MILVLDALQALECTECAALIEIDRAVSEDAELRVRWIEHVTREHDRCGRVTDDELEAKARKKKLHRYRPMRGQF